MTLELLSREVSALDVDDAIEQSVVLERALLVQTFWNEPHQWFARPWRNTVPQPWWQLLRPWLGHRAVALICDNERATAGCPAAVAGSPASRRPPSTAGTIALRSSDHRAVLGRHYSLSARSARGLHRSAALAHARFVGAGRHRAIPPGAQRFGAGPPGDSRSTVSRSSADRSLLRRGNALSPLTRSRRGLQRREEPQRRRRAEVGRGAVAALGLYREDQPPPDVGLVMRLSVGSEKR